MAWYNTIGIGGGNGPGPGEQMWAQYYAQQAAKAQQDQVDQEALAKGLAARTAATGTARQQAEQYFKDRGLDPAQFDPDIDARINDLLTSVDPKDTAPGQYLRDIGSYVADQKRTGMRSKATQDVNSLLPQDFASSRITDQFDDPFIGQADVRERGKADTYIQNLLKRGVITATGATGAENYLNDQGGRVRSQLDQLGQGILESGRDRLQSIGDRAHQNAGSLELGQTFDANKYGTDLDNAYNDFSTKFSDQFNASVPMGLYDTSGISTAAGQASGAQNTAFDPYALAGKVTPETPLDEDPTKKNKQTPLF